MRARHAPTDQIGPYRAVRELKPGLCNWLLVTGDDGEHVVQIIRAPVSAALAKKLTARLELVQRLGNPDFLSATDVFEAPGIGFAVRYDAWIAEELECTPDGKSANEVAPLIVQGTLALLRQLHEAGVFVGAFTLDSILWKDGRVKLYSFLYDLLISENLLRIRDKGDSVLAPELRGARGAAPNPSSDLWSLAQLVGPWSDEVRATEWFAKFGMNDPARRPVRAGNCYLLRKSDLGVGTEMHWAARNGLIEEIDRLLQAGSAVDARAWDGRTPLHDAANEGYMEAAAKLITAGAEPNARDEGGRTPLHKAAAKGHLDVVAYLVANTANANAKASNGAVPMHDAALRGHIPVIQVLMETGADVNATDDSGSTPLMAAAFAGRIDASSVLVDLGADVNARSYEGATPLGIAVRRGHGEVEELLRAHGAIE